MARRIVGVTIGVARRMTAGEQLRAEKKVWRFGQLLVGLVGYGTALTFLESSGVGAASWNVLSEGISRHTGLTFGWVTNLVAVVVLVFWIPLRELPGVGTCLNVLLVGTSSDVVARVLPVPDSLAAQLLYYGLGLLMLTFFDAVYLGARFGSGPRDGLMTGAVRVSGRPVWLVRTVIEGIVLLIGVLLGAGTVVIALAMGPCVQYFLRFTTVRLVGDTVSL